MSITFYNDAKCNWIQKELPCYCAQREIDYRAMDNDCDERTKLLSKTLDDVVIGRDATEKEKRHLFDSIHQFAKGDCPICHGKGFYIDSKHWSCPIYINWANGNAFPILTLLGIPEANLECGNLSIPKARQAIFRALNKPVDSAVREEEIVYGKPRQHEDGTIELKPVRVHSAGLSEEKIIERLNRLMEFVLLSAEQGATEISWS